MITKAAEPRQLATTAKSAVYARSAVNDEASIQRQVGICGFACGPASEPAAVYVDDGWSGMDMARPGLQALMEDVRHQSFDHLVFEEPQRLSRSLLHTHQIIETLIDRGVATYCVEQGRLVPFLSVVTAHSRYERPPRASGGSGSGRRDRAS
jgi:DNA invertase Pin-like site-specific DNA recombinase